MDGRVIHANALAQQPAVIAAADGDEARLRAAGERPAAGLAGRARRSGGTVVILNPTESEIDAEAHLVLRGTAAQLLPALLAD